jgi:DNA-directed RNA polymerase subunit RPC12/RpoP
MTFEFISAGNTYSEYKCSRCQLLVVVDDEDFEPSNCPHCGAPRLEIPDAATVSADPASGPDETVVGVVTPTFVRGFREGMTSEELATELSSVMKHFRPTIAEIAANSLRWEFITLHSLPVENEDVPVNNPNRWAARIRSKNGTVLDVYHGATMKYAVDAAMAAVASGQALHDAVVGRPA